MSCSVNQYHTNANANSKQDHGGGDDGFCQSSLGEVEVPNGNENQKLQQRSSSGQAISCIPHNSTRHQHLNMMLRPYYLKILTEIMWNYFDPKILQ